MNFPRTEIETTSLCEQMIAGLELHAEDFSGITPAMLAEMQAALADYHTQRAAQEEAQAQAKVLTSRKAEKLEKVIELMKANIKRAQIDCTQAPEKLGYIGWGPRADAQGYIPTPPSQPRVLRIIAEGSGDIWFEWDEGEKSRINNWIIERRDQLAPGGDFGPWLLAGTSVNTQAHLTGQPVGVKMEYRVRAVNTAGESTASNTMAAVL